MRETLEQAADLIDAAAKLLYRAANDAKDAGDKDAEHSALSLAQAADSIREDISFHAL